MDTWYKDTRNGFLAYRVPKEDLQLMEQTYLEKFPKSSKLNDKTVVDDPNSRKAGIIGEIVFDRYTDGEADWVASYNKSVPYDFIYKGVKVDVKCKKRGVIPLAKFEASIYEYQSAEYFSEVENYFFMSTIPPFDSVWLCGCSSKESWLANPNIVLWKKGVIDPTNHKEFVADTWSVQYKYLPQPTLKP